MPLPPASILDTSALLAYIYDERGGKAVEGELKDGAALSLVHWGEVLTVTVRRGGTVARLKQQWSDAGILGDNGLLSLIPVLESDTEVAANLYPTTARGGLSLGDRLCIATAMRLRLPIVTADRIWSSLQISGVEMRIIR